MLKKFKDFTETKRFCDLLVIGTIICHFTALSLTQFMIFNLTNDDIVAKEYGDEEQAVKLKSDLEHQQIEIEANPFIKMLFQNYGYSSTIMIEFIFFSFIAYYIFYLRPKLSVKELSYATTILFFIMLFDAMNDLSAFFGSLYYGQIGVVTGLKAALQLNLTKVLGGLC